MSRRFWVVCLMLALLPMRGWATASMPVASMLGTTSVQTTSAVPPCHTQKAGASVTVCQACDLCTLCHGVMAPSALPTLPASGNPNAAPVTLASRDTGRRLIGGLERPPRLFLA